MRSGETIYGGHPSRQLYPTHCEHNHRSKYDKSSKQPMGAKGGVGGGGGADGEHTGCTSAQLSGHAAISRSMRSAVLTGG